MEASGVIWYVDIEHQDAIHHPGLAEMFTETRQARAQVVGEAADLPCEAIFYWEVSWHQLRARHVRALTLSGNTTDWDKYDFASFKPLFNIVQSGELPVIGFCGGHQLIGLMYGMPCGALRQLKPGEPDPADWAPGYYKEIGYLPVQLLKPGEPLFEKLGDQPVFFESHYWEIKALHADFELLAATENCHCQAIKHRKLPIYGTQFHPEVNSADFHQGFELLQNFFRLAGIRKA
jgi:GMP synthase-like glutamine amidotransferase